MPLKIKLILTTLIERSIERSFTMNKYSYVIMNKYSFVNIINLEATRKLFLQLFSKSEEIFFYLLVFTKYFNVNYRKANKRLELTNRLITKPKGVTLMIKELSNAHHRKECINMNNNQLIKSYTQAFFTTIFGWIQNEQ